VAGSTGRYISIFQNRAHKGGEENFPADTFTIYTVVPKLALPTAHQ
jgi:hypothetical protein